MQIFAFLMSTLSRAQPWPCGACSFVNSPLAPFCQNCNAGPGAHDPTWGNADRSVAAVVWTSFREHAAPFETASAQSAPPKALRAKPLLRTSSPAAHSVVPPVYSLAGLKTRIAQLEANRQALTQGTTRTPAVHGPFWHLSMAEVGRLLAYNAQLVDCFTVQSAGARASVGPVSHAAAARGRAPGAETRQAVPVSRGKGRRGKHKPHEVREVQPHETPDDQWNTVGCAGTDRRSNNEDAPWKKGPGQKRSDGPGGSVNGRSKQPRGAGPKSRHAGCKKHSPADGFVPPSVNSFASLKAVRLNKEILCGGEDDALWDAGQAHANVKPDGGAECGNLEFADVDLEPKGGLPAADDPNMELFPAGLFALVLAMVATSLLLVRGLLDGC